MSGEAGMKLMTAAEMVTLAQGGSVWYAGRERDGCWPLAWSVTAETNDKGNVELSGPPLGEVFDTMKPTTRVYAEAAR
jgi:hypothetical protein